MKIVFFDGYCTLCNGVVDWLISHDPKKNLKFASLQGETSRKLIHQSDRSVDFDTLVYYREGKTFERSEAVLKILFDLGGVWKCSNVFWVIPGFARNCVYRWVARNRYRVFGKKDSCRVPTMEEKNLLLP